MQRVRIGIDVGGTFTDIFLFDEVLGQLAVQKVPSTPQDPSQAIVDGALLILQENRVPVQDVVYFAHGSTVATNALIQHKGAKVGLITTSGFRDLLEIGRQVRPHLYDLQVDKPEPLVGRDLRLEVRERTSYDGRVLLPLAQEDVLAAVARLKRDGVEAVAICYLHGYRNPDHEQQTKAIVQKEMPGVYLSVSYEVLPEFREFERLNTTVVNAYLGPGMSRYLHNLAAKLQDAGICCKPYITQSNGGIISLESAAQNTARTVLSGPSGGVMGASYVCNQAGFQDLITFDMGGTSTDVSLVNKGQAMMTTQRELGGYPVKTPMIDVHSIGAGGGSIGWVDLGGLLKVGPQSAGADPGPACYNRGGQEATVTDANVVIGALNPEYLLGGRMKIDAKLAREAVHRLALKLDLDDVAAAQGMLSVVVANMVRAVRVISVQRGYDPRRYVLVSFGGAGPLHSGWLTRELNMQRTLVPQRPGLLCAFGLLVTDVRSDFLQTRITQTHNADLHQIGDVYAQLERQAHEWLDRESIPPERRLFHRSVDMRYVGQNYELSVPLPSEAFDQHSMDTVLREFYRTHDQTYGYAVEGEPTELVTFRVEALSVVQKVPSLSHLEAGPKPPKQAHLEDRQVYLDGGWTRTPVYDRAHLLPSNVINGPAVIEQMDATTLLLPGQRGTVDRFMNILVEDSLVQ
ncbi:MAG: hydantoinase/oxoprolinase family protein [Chloroflexi bacterium]|nr:hydantoinase/oxoprolinase family protein [Chloroflexota bacterium]